MQTDLPPRQSSDWLLYENSFTTGYCLQRPNGWNALIDHAHRTENELATLAIWNVALSVAVVGLAAWVFALRKRTRPPPR